MRASLTGTVALLLLGVLETEALAQPPVASGSTQLAELLKLADQLNPMNGSARASADVRSFGSAQVRGLDTRLQLGIMNRSLRNLEAMPGVGMTELRVMRMLPPAGTLDLRRELAAAEWNTYSAMADERIWETRASVARRYYQLYALQEQLAIAREDILLLAVLSSAAATMYASGEGEQSDVVRSHLMTSQFIEDTITLVAKRTEALALLGADVGTDNLILAAPVVLPDFPESVPEIGVLRDMAFSGRGMLRAGAAEVEYAETMKRLETREGRPEVELGFAYSQGAPATIMEGGVRTERMFSVMIGVNLPFLTRHSRTAAIAAASAMESVAAAELRAAQDRTAAVLRTTLADLERTRSMKALYAGTVIPQLRALREASMSALKHGRGGMKEVLEALLELNRARSMLAMLESDEGMVWAELEMLTGSALIDMGADHSDADRGGAI